MIPSGNNGPPVDISIEWKKHWLLGGWYPRGIMILQQMYRPSNINKKVYIKFVLFDRICTIKRHSNLILQNMCHAWDITHCCCGIRGVMTLDKCVLFGLYHDPHNNEVISLIPIIFCCLYFVFHYLCLSSSIVFCYFESTYGPNTCWHQAVHETIMFTFIEHFL